jgi:hypothetical protein
VNSFKKDERRKLILKILKNKRHLWIGHTIRHNELLEGAISGKKASTSVLKASRQKHRS